MRFLKDYRSKKKRPHKKEHFHLKTTTMKRIFVVMSQICIITKLTSSIIPNFSTISPSLQSLCPLLIPFPDKIEYNNRDNGANRPTISYDWIISIINWTLFLFIILFRVKHSASFKKYCFWLIRYKILLSHYFFAYY